MRELLRPPPSPALLTTHVRPVSGSPHTFMPWMLFLLAFLARMAAWPFADVVDADAVTRSLLGESTLSYPGWVGDGVWLPLHFYLNAIFIFIAGTREAGPVLLNILLGSAIVFPVFAFARRWADATVASAVAVIIVFDPLIFRNSLQGLSEIPFLFFAACGINTLSRALDDRTYKGRYMTILAGILMTMASGIRYEAWLLIVLLSSVCLVIERRRLAYFIAPAVIFPLVWMTTTYLAYGQLLIGMAHVLTFPSGSISNEVDATEMLTRTIFFPLSFLLVMTPLAIAVVFFALFRSAGDNEISKRRWPWLLLFPVFMIIMIVKARNAELLMQHRFTMTLILLFVPYLVQGFRFIRSRTLTIALTALICGTSLYSASGGAFRSWPGITNEGSLWNDVFTGIRDRTIAEVDPIPKLHSDLPDLLLTMIEPLVKERRLLVLDHFGWEETYNVALRSKIIAPSIVFLPWDGDAQQGVNKLDHYLRHISGFDGILLIKSDGGYPAIVHKAQDGRLYMTLHTKQLLLDLIDEADGITIYVFEVIDIPDR